MMKTIEIIVSPTGQATVQTKGFAGSSCHAASRFLEQALGTQLSGERTAEYYHTESVRQSAREEA